MGGSFEYCWTHDHRRRPRHATVGPGVTLASLDAALGAQDPWYPPVPTFTGATRRRDRVDQRGRRGDLQVRDDQRHGCAR